MSKLSVASFSISLDGYGAGPSQSREEPLGVGGESLHDWMVETKAFAELVGGGGGSGGTGVDDRFVRREFENVGAWILGRNMFAASRGPWPPDDPWKGWWGDNPPYHCDVFVLTHHAREPIAMKGGTTFRFATGGIHEALERARASAGGKDVRLGGGAATIREYLEARLVDEMHVAISPVLLGSGESLFGGLDLLGLGYRVAEHAAGERAMHTIIARA